MQPRELQNGHALHQIQSSGMTISDDPHFEGGAAASPAVHDDFLDQMLSGIPSSWPDLGNPKSPWDLAGGQKIFGIEMAGKPAEGADEEIHLDPYDVDESLLLAARLRQNQISGGGGTGKSMLLQLSHQQQQLILQGMGRSPASSAVDSGLLPMMPLSLGRVADSQIFPDEGSEGFFNGIAGGSLQRAAQLVNHQHFQESPMLAQNFGTSPAGVVAGQAPAAATPSGIGAAAQPRQRVRARRGQATDPHSIAERLRRERIAERMKALQELVPNANKTDKASMLDEIIDYVKFLQLQVKVLSMSRLGGASAVAAPLVADTSSEASGGAGRGGGGVAQAAMGDGQLSVTEHQVAKLMEEDMGSAMQYLQGKGLCLMPISLASAISAATAGRRHGLAGAASDSPPSPSVSALTVQSAVAGGLKQQDAASVSKP